MKIIFISTTVLVLAVNCHVTNAKSLRAVNSAQCLYKGLETGLKPQQAKMEGCEVYICDEEGEVTYFNMSEYCPTPPCVDFVLSDDGCCNTCPNGKNDVEIQ